MMDVARDSKNKKCNNSKLSILIAFELSLLDSGGVLSALIMNVVNQILLAEPPIMSDSRSRIPSEDS